MILSRAPVRISLGGGGTDLKSYYAKNGGFLVAGAINKYCTIVANKAFDDTIRLRYSEMEDIADVATIKHPILRAALKLTGIDKEIEIHSIADIPSGCGLGTSSCFTVASLNALHAYQNDFVTQQQLAEEACYIEIDMLKEPIGKQDQYMAAFGGLTCLTFGKNGNVVVEPLRASHETIDRLESNLVMFFTKKLRSASQILTEQDTKCKESDEEMTRNLDQVKQIGYDTKRYLENGEVDKYGELLHEHWELKKRRSSKMTDESIDGCYETALKNGAIGGKLIGAGGGGFLIFYCKNNNHDKINLVTAMQKMGLKWERFRFDSEGAKIVVNT